jgi:glycosyltransferase involved in cell wall biosynthesis
MRLSRSGGRNYTQALARGLTMPIELVPYGLDLSWMRNYHGKTPRNVLSFGFIGQISPRKGPHLLIDAYKRVMGDCEAR